MHLTYFKAANFRNLGQLEIIPSPKVNLLYGPNGSGKTNILEGIFLLCLGKSQRGNADNVLVRSGEEAYRVEGKIADGSRMHEVTVAYLSRGRKQIKIDGITSRLPDLYAQFGAVSIGPEDSELLSGPPSARRLFMDLYISQYSKKYLETLTRYNRIVAQKNAALKYGLEFDTFNSLMIIAGTEIMKTRGEFLNALMKQSSALYNRFSRGANFGIEYAPSVLEESNFDENLVESQFEKRLDDSKEKEKILKTALIGPHRDDVKISINHFPARTHGSQGEWRSSAIALKLSVYKLLKAKRKFSPILLLDEVFAELDSERAEALIDSFEEFEQLFLTTADEPPRQLSRKAAKFRISEGRSEEIN